MKFNLEEEIHIAQFYQENPQMNLKEIALRFSTTVVTLRSLLKRQNIRIGNKCRFYSSEKQKDLEKEYRISVYGYDKLTNEVFNFWTVLFITANTYQRIYLCQCECGHTGSVSKPNLVNSVCKSCGCQKSKLLSESKKGAKNSNYHGGRPSCEICQVELKNYRAKLCWNCLIETKALTSLVPRGSNHYRWVPEEEKNTIKDLRSAAAYGQWRRQVMERDLRQCQFCGSKKSICADHIQPVAWRPDLVYDTENGRVLCQKCHEKTPTFGGRIRRKING